tara:strand:+ start:2513 stop:3592 length:1080 start_codon:yes stop_codon:yes gene_type:complete
MKEGIVAAAAAQAGTLGSELVPVGNQRMLRRSVRVPLSLEGGTLTSLTRRVKSGNSWETVLQPPFINANGYNEMNRHAGVSFQTPDSVTVDGERRPNPYYKEDPKTGSVDLVYVRMVGTGRNASGSIVSVDHTVIYSPRLYFIEDLHGKERRFKDAVQGFGLAPGGEIPPGKFYFPEVSTPGGGSLGMLIDPRHPEVRKALATLTQRVKKAVSIAQTFCRRDILKKMLGTSLFGLSQNGEAFAVVTAWTEQSASPLSAASADVSEVASVAEVVYDELALGEGVDDVAPQEIATKAIDVEGDDGERSAMMSDLRAKYAEIGKDKFESMVESCDIDPKTNPSQLSDEELFRVHAKITGGDS